MISATKTLICVTSDGLALLRSEGSSSVAVLSNGHSIVVMSSTGRSRTDMPSGSTTATTASRSEPTASSVPEATTVTEEENVNMTIAQAKEHAAFAEVFSQRSESEQALLVMCLAFGKLEAAVKDHVIVANHDLDGNLARVLNDLK
jgi:hypothetical protein